MIKYIKMSVQMQNWGLPSLLRIFKGYSMTRFKKKIIKEILYVIIWLKKVGKSFL